MTSMFLAVQLWPLLTGCSMGPNEETLVDELRVLATITDPPEAGAGETVAVETTVLDPLDRGYEALSWPCTFTGEGCLEAEGLTGETWSGLSHTPDLSGTSTLADSVQLSPALADFLSDEPVPLVQLWTMACEPGLCPVMDLAASEPAPDSAEASELQELLANPSDQLADLPFQGVTLGVRWLYASTRAEEDRLVNPTVACEVVSQDTGIPTVEPGGSLDFTCFVSGEFTGFAGAWAYTTAGGWEGAQYLLDPGVEIIEYAWFAPEEAPADPEVPLWMVVVDGEGGVGLWSGAARVE